MAALTASCANPQSKNEKNKESQVQAEKKES